MALPALFSIGGAHRERRHAPVLKQNAAARTKKR